MFSHLFARGMRGVGISAICAATFACATSGRASTIDLQGTVRDFHSSFTSTSPFTPEANGNPQFEMSTVDSNNPNGPSRIPAGYGGLAGLQAQVAAAEPGIVAQVLGADNKPVWVGGSNPLLFPTTKTKVNAAGDNLEVNSDDNQNRANFNQWYNDTPSFNQSKAHTLTLSDAGHPGTFTYSNPSFYPIDGQLFGNEGRDHNFHFTLESHATFTAHAGQTMTFTGDDDAWVFINKQLVIDLGGVHGKLTGAVNIDSLGLTDGKKYSFDFFFAERNTFGSEFEISTSIPLDRSGSNPPPGIPLPAALIPGFVMLGGLGGWFSVRARRRAV